MLVISKRCSVSGTAFNWQSQQFKHTQMSRGKALSEFEETEKPLTGGTLPRLKRSKRFVTPTCQTTDWFVHLALPSLGSILISLE